MRLPPSGIESARSLALESTSGVSNGLVTLAHPPGRLNLAPHGALQETAVLADGHHLKAGLDGVPGMCTVIALDPCCDSRTMTGLPDRLNGCGVPLIRGIKARGQPQAQRQVGRPDIDGINAWSRRDTQKCPAFRPSRSR